jgi:hypothetical protein
MRSREDIALSWTSGVSTVIVAFEKAIADLGPAAQVLSFLNVALTEVVLMILHRKEVVPMAQTQTRTMSIRIVDLVSRVFTAIGIATFLGAALCPQ